MLLSLSRFKVYIELLRPPLAPMDLAMPAASALLASYAVSGGLPPLFPFLIATLGAYSAITSSYVFNDCCDIDVDKIAMPDRPLPMAKLSKREAQGWSFLLFLLAAAAGPLPKSRKLCDPISSHNYNHHLLRLGQEKYALLLDFCWPLLRPGALRCLAGHGACRLLNPWFRSSSCSCNSGGYDRHHRLGFYQLRRIAGCGRRQRERNSDNTSDLWYTCHREDGQHYLAHRRRSLPGLGTLGWLGMALHDRCQRRRRLAALAKPELRSGIQLLSKVTCYSISRPTIVPSSF